MSFSPIPIWKEAPFTRLLVPFIAGILIQWYLRWPALISCCGAFVALCFMALFSREDITRQFRKYWIFGMLLNSWLFFAGILIIYVKDGSNNHDWIVAHYRDSVTIVATLQEPLSPKPKSFKTLASVQMIRKDSLSNVAGKIIIYFQKDSIAPELHYGSKLIFKKTLQAIRNTGNPGSFDYKRHCAFQQIYYQVYLKAGEYNILPAARKSRFNQFLFDTRKVIISVLRNYIPGDRESGLAEALLIGYKDDLDKDLVQSYTNTGVVHIIAISGLHVGLIYWLLTKLLIPFTQRRKVKWLKPVLVITGLWLFSLLAGGSPSVLRSAVMFTAIVMGESMSRRISVFNSLAASAFLLLCYNPFWLWDVGFQLSYAAVLSIIIFMKPVYNCWFIQNKLLDAIWKLNAVTLSAQILTVPICLYYFHQFPNFFLVTNLVAVPLSSIILIVELLLCLAFPMPSIAKLTGWILYWLIRFMNSFIEFMSSLPFSVLENIQISLFQVICSYLIIISIAIWLTKRMAHAFLAALIGLFIFGMLRFGERLNTLNQKRLIVYNIPNHQAIEFIDGRDCVFKGDSILLENEFLIGFHIKPSRILHRTTPVQSLNSLICDGTYYYFGNKHIVTLKEQLAGISTAKRAAVDIIIISGNPKMSMTGVNRSFTCRKVIFDASNSLRNITRWKIECDQLNIPYHSVPEKGAFVMNVN